MSSKGDFYRWLARLARDPDLAERDAPALEAMIAAAEAYVAGDEGRGDALLAGVPGMLFARQVLAGGELGSRPAA